MGTEATLMALMTAGERWNGLPKQVRREAARMNAAERDSAALRQEAAPERHIKAVRADGKLLLTILEAARSLPPTFHLEDLLVAAWKLSPERFGMRKFNFPDMNRMKSCIYGKRGLIAHGFLDLVSPNVLRLGSLAG